MNRQNFALLAPAILCLWCGCAERQEANLPYASNVLAYLGRTPVRGIAQHVASAEGLAFVADSPFFGISVYDLSNPGQPLMADTLELNNPNDQDASFVTVDSAGRLMVAQNTNYLDLYDLQTGSYLVNVGTWGAVEAELYFHQDTLEVYRTDHGDGFYWNRFLNTGSGDTLVFGAPFFTSYYITSQAYGFARMAGTPLTYVCLDVLGIALVDHSAANAAMLVMEMDVPGQVRDAAISGNVLCLAAGYEGLITLDISDPVNPIQLGSLLISNSIDIEYVQTAGDRAYVLDTNDGLFAVDISNPANPVLIGALLTSNPNNFCLTGDLVLIADEDMGLVVGQIIY